MRWGTVLESGRRVVASLAPSRKTPGFYTLAFGMHDSTERSPGLAEVLRGLRRSETQRLDYACRHVIMPRSCSRFSRALCTGTAACAPRVSARAILTRGYGIPKSLIVPHATEKRRAISRQPPHTGFAQRLHKKCNHATESVSWFNVYV